MSYVPKRGDLVWLTFDPQASHEQAGRRPAFVLSPEAPQPERRLAPDKWQVGFWAVQVRPGEAIGVLAHKSFVL